MKTRYIFFIVAMTMLAGCKPVIDEFAPSKGEADFSRYIAVGDFWTAGFADGALYKSGQENSFPAILGRQFTHVQGGEFKQPLMLDDYGVGLSTGVPMPKLELDFRPDCKGVVGLLPGFADVQVDPANFASIAAGGPYNNIGMPGLKSIYMGVPGFAVANPYYARFASAQLNKVMDEIPPVNATFFTLWLGMFDVLYYAMQGGTGDVITPLAQYSAAMQATLDVLTANGAKGAVANIPDITGMAFFNTIPYNALALPDQATADMLNYAYAPLNQIIKGAGSTDTLSFQPGPNPLVIIDEDLPWGIRQIRSDEFVLLSLPQDSLKCAGWGSQKPVASPYILKKSEIDAITEAIDGYNSTLAEMVQNNDIALVDMHSVMKIITDDGLAFEGVRIDSRFIQGNFYSLDGLNPSPRGSAVVAYYFIDAINRKFNANIPQVTVSDFTGVKLP
ncbi:MAG: hypothetical protein R6W71_11550 [Bacteroidales bacterium]